MTHATLQLMDALQQILKEVTPGNRPYSSDSYLPQHLVELAQKALEEAFNGS